MSHSAYCRVTIFARPLRNYAEHIETYCHTVPLDYICYDYYPYADAPEKTLKWERGWYDNLEETSVRARRTGRSLWVIGQTCTKPKNVKFLTENNFRFQLNASLAYGATYFEWACWQPGWWTNSVIAPDGSPTEHHAKLQRINADMRRLAPDYMRFRNVATTLLRFRTSRPFRALGDDGRAITVATDADGARAFSLGDCRGALVIFDL